MPAVRFKVAWPDGQHEVYYSPSTVIHDYLSAGKSYSQAQFAKQVTAGLQHASERVREKFGYACTAAMAESEKIEAKLAWLKRDNTDGEVTVTEFLR